MLVHVGIHNLLRGNHLPQEGKGLQGALLTWQPASHPHPDQVSLYTQPPPLVLPSLSSFLTQTASVPGAPRASRPPAAWPPGRSAQVGWGPRPPSQGRGLQRSWRETMIRGKQSARGTTCAHPTPSWAIGSHPLPPARFLLTPHVMAHRLGYPSLFGGRQSFLAPTMRPFCPG